jgi:hypothetical protein
LCSANFLREFPEFGVDGLIGGAYNPVQRRRRTLLATKSFASDGGSELLEKGLANGIGKVLKVTEFGGTEGKCETAVRSDPSACDAGPVSGSLTTE